MSAPTHIEGIRIDDPRVCVSALKAAESGEGWILRLVNLSAQEPGGTELTFGLWQILTLHLRRDGRA